MRSLAVVMVAWVVGGCVEGQEVLYLGDTGVDAPPDRPDSFPRPSEMHAIVRNDCAPDHGPALTYVFTTEILGCEASVSQGKAWLTFWSSFPMSQGGYTVGDGTLSSGSTGAWCEQGSCQPATSGSLVLTSYSPPTGGASGTVTLVLRDGTTHTATFRSLLRCSNSPGC